MKKKILACLLGLSLLISPAMSMEAHADGQGDVNEFGQSYIVLGADLSNDQYKTVLELLEVSEDELEDYVQLEVTNAEEHQYLDAYLSSSVIGSKAFSSVKLIPTEEGSGLEITTKNISYCTVEMYQNALVTAGLKDAEVTIAGPTEISGTAALIGAVKAYADSTGTEVNEEALEAATNEIVLTGKIGESLGDSEDATALMAYVKQKVVEGDLSSEEDIRAAVNDGCKELGLDLTEDQKDQVVALMQKISKLDIDPDTLASQAQDVYDKLKDFGIDLEKVDTNSIVWFIKNFFQQIMDFLNSLFS